MKLKNIFNFGEKPNVSTLQELGDTGTTMYNGMISGEEYNYDLSGTAKYIIYDKMRKGDATIAATLRVLKLPLRSANWYIESAGEDKIQQEQAKFIEYNLKEGMSITWDDFLRQALLMLDYGVFVFEKVYDNIDYNGKTYIGWRKFAPRHPRTIQAWKINDGKDDGIKQLVNNRDYVSIPIEKLLIFVNDKEGDNWEGISILRAAYKNWFFKDIFEQIDAMAFERQGLGVPYCKVPAGANDKDKANATAIVKNLRANEKAYVVYPEGYEVGFLDMGASKTRDPKNSIEYHNRQIALNVLAQFLMLGASDKGSFALSKDQSSFFYDSLQATAKNILDNINKYAIKQLVDLNWPGTKDYPQLKVDDIGAIDKVQFVTMINTLVGANIIKTDDDLNKYIRKELDLPEEQEKDENDIKTDQLESKLELLSIDTVGEGGQQNNEIQQAAMTEDQEDELQMKEEFDDFKLIFVAKGKPMDEATKKKISEALMKKYGTTAKPEDIETASTAQEAIIDAKRRIDEIKAVIDNYKTKAKSIVDKKVKNDFNKAIASKIDEIKNIIKDGREGIKAEKERARQGEGNIKKDIKERKMELRKTRLSKRIERDMLRVERLENELDKTDSSSKQKTIKQRITDVKDLLKERKDTLQEMEASFAEPEQKKNLKQLSDDFKPWRKYTAAEKKVNFGNIKNEMDKQEKAFEKLLKGALIDEKSDLLKQFNAAIKNKDYKTIQTIGLQYSGKYKDEVFAKMKELYNFGKNGVAAEMKVTPPANPKDEMERLSAQASVMVDDHEIKVLTKTKMTALDSMAKKAAAAETIARVGKTMDEAIEELSQQTASIITGGSFNQGRRLTQFSNKGKIYAFQRSELLDERTCNFCMSMDGRVIDINDPMAGEDIFHSNCRGLWVEIMKDEAELPTITDIPKSLTKDYEGVNNFKQLKSPQVTKASLAADAIKEEYTKQINERKKKLLSYEKEDKYPDRQKGHKSEITRMKKVIDKLK